VVLVAGQQETARLEAELRDKVITAVVGVAPATGRVAAVVVLAPQEARAAMEWAETAATVVQHQSQARLSHAQAVAAAVQAPH
jgi:long-subunit acyl-CoA synthetase (AMP-forming)